MDASGKAAAVALLQHALKNPEPGRLPNPLRPGVPRAVGEGPGKKVGRRACPGTRRRPVLRSTPRRSPSYGPWRDARHVASR